MVKAGRMGFEYTYTLYRQPTAGVPLVRAENGVGPGRIKSATATPTAPVILLLPLISTAMARYTSKTVIGGSALELTGRRIDEGRI